MPFSLAQVAIFFLRPFVVAPMARSLSATFSHLSASEPLLIQSGSLLERNGTRAPQ